MEDFSTRVRHPHGFRITQPARERGFLTPSGRAEFGPAPLPGDTDPAEGRLMLATVRSHDQFNTTIYSNDDRYRGLRGGLRTVVFMNSGDMKDRRLDEFDLVDITSSSREGSRRTVHGYRAIRYEIPRFAFDQFPGGWPASAAARGSRSRWRRVAGRPRTGKSAGR